MTGVPARLVIATLVAPTALCTGVLLVRIDRLIFEGVALVVASIAGGAWLVRRVGRLSHAERLSYRAGMYVPVTVIGGMLVVTALVHAVDGDWDTAISALSTVVVGLLVLSIGRRTDESS